MDIKKKQILATDVLKWMVDDDCDAVASMRQVVLMNTSLCPSLEYQDITATFIVRK